MSSKPGPQGSLVMLWAGENPALHRVLLERLQAADIPFSDLVCGSGYFLHFSSGGRGFSSP
jgi:hypothetical protein